MKRKFRILFATATLLAIGACAKKPYLNHTGQITDQLIAQQRNILAENTKNKGYGPQSPRDIDSIIGNNSRTFTAAPAYTEMNLCNIHFHKNAEHKGGEFTRYAGNGNGDGYLTGYLFSGQLGAAELINLDAEICPGEKGGLSSGDTIEVHFVYTSAQIEPGASLGACLSESILNPQLRVEAQVYVLANNKSSLKFNELTQTGLINNRYQAANMPKNLGTPVQYAGSTTGPGYNEKGSPLAVTWRVHPKVAKVNIETLGDWCKDNIFDEDHAHGVRNLVINPDLLSNF